MLAGGVHRRGGALGGRKVVDGPPHDREFRVPGVVAVFDAVAVLEECPAVAVDKDRAKRLVTVVERLLGKLHAATETLEVLVADRHRR